MVSFKSLAVLSIFALASEAWAQAVSPVPIIGAGMCEVMVLFRLSQTQSLFDLARLDWNVATSGQTLGSAFHFVLGFQSQVPFRPPSLLAQLPPHLVHRKQREYVAAVLSQFCRLIKRDEWERLRFELTGPKD
ncbi:hypothetical protein BDN72DRAFT_901952 [Pluteus cervinus]|uniref:Uncharacterized protein n=1 Tax=Pluteus cervinus TaxID=181527 RepID=A0ACD3AF75_9AGAR|nr:hypothetical protein BDN72DRAFT_901952 [Pluteus cervinus]